MNQWGNSVKVCLVRFDPNSSKRRNKTALFISPDCDRLALLR
jgi:hypothetical protein